MWIAGSVSSRLDLASGSCSFQRPAPSQETGSDSMSAVASGIVPAPGSPDLLFSGILVGQSEEKDLRSHMRGTVHLLFHFSAVLHLQLMAIPPTGTSVESVQTELRELFEAAEVDSLDVWLPDLRRYRISSYG